MGTRSLLWFVGVWTLGGCGSSAAPVPSAPEAKELSKLAMTPASAIPAHLVCQKNADCVVACRVKTVCCGELCECGAVLNRARDREIRQWETENCKNAECPVADCDVPEFNHEAVCVEGRCRDQRTPWKRPTP